MRDDLRRAQGAVVLPFDTAAGLARLQAGMKVGGGTVAPATAGGGWTTGPGWKVLAAFGVTGLIGWMLLADPAIDARNGEVPETGPVLVSDGPVLPEKRASDREPVVPAVDAARAADPAVQPSSPETKKAKPQVALPVAQPEKSDPLADEIVHLGQLRNLQKTDPTAAITAARAGHEKFPSGVLYEEREALLILSLQKVGSGSEAARRLEVFRARFPKSAFLSKMGAGTSAEPKGTVKPAP